MEAHDVGEAARLERERERARVRVFVKEWIAVKRKSNQNLRYGPGIKMAADSDKEDEHNQVEKVTAVASSSINNSLWDLAGEYVKGAGSFHGRYLRHRRQIIRRFRDTNPEDEQLVSKKAFKDRNIQLYCESRFVECSHAGLSPWQTVHQIKGELNAGHWKDEDFYWSSDGDSVASANPATQSSNTSLEITASSTEWAESPLAEKPRSLSPSFTRSRSVSQTSAKPPTERPLSPFLARSQSDSQKDAESPTEWMDEPLVEDPRFPSPPPTPRPVSSSSSITLLFAPSESVSDKSQSTVRNGESIVSSPPQGSVLYELASTGCAIFIILLVLYLGYTVLVICLRILRLVWEEGLQF